MKETPASSDEASTPDDRRGPDSGTFFALGCGLFLFLGLILIALDASQGFSAAVFSPSSEAPGGSKLGASWSAAARRIRAHERELVGQIAPGQTRLSREQISRSRRVVESMELTSVAWRGLIRELEEEMARLRDVRLRALRAVNINEALKQQARSESNAGR